MSRMGNSAQRPTGFSLIEVVTVIGLTGVLAIGLSNLLQHPLNGYAAVSRRTELVALADLALRRMARDLRLALPNSVRIAAGGRALELLHTRGGGRYRLEPGVNQAGGPNEEDHGDPSDRLSFGGDDSFNVLGRIQSFAFDYGVPLPLGSRLAIYPTGSSVWGEAATDSDPSVITPSATRITIVDDGDEDQIRLSADHRFALESPGRRLFVVDTPVSYVCDPIDGSLWRVEGYPITAAQPIDRAAPPLATGSAARAADRIERCRFQYVPGTASRAGLVTMEIVLESADERVRLLQQVQVRNAP